MDRSFLDKPRWAIRALRLVMRAMPSGPRCHLCYSPFGGVGGRIVAVAGFARSRKNPNFCNSCFEKAPQGGLDMDIGVMFADMRGFTAMSETMTPGECATVVNRFYAAAADVLIASDAVIDKMAGDEVMALFVPLFISGDHVRKMVAAAGRLLAAVGAREGEQPWCPLGIGLDAGHAFVGNVGAGEVKDFTAIGDVVNTAARLQAAALAGQIVMSAAVYEHVRDAYPRAAPVELVLRGKAKPVQAYVLDPAVERSPTVGASA